MELVRCFEEHLKSVLGSDDDNDEATTGKMEEEKDWEVINEEEVRNDEYTEDTNHKEDYMIKIESALLTSPTQIRSSVTGKKRLQYVFDSESPTGAYHRLLVHAVCKFHGLHSLSSDTKVMIGDEKKQTKDVARVLTISGKFQAGHLQLLDHLKQLEDSKEKELKHRENLQKKADEAVEAGL